MRLASLVLVSLAGCVGCRSQPHVPSTGAVPIESPSEPYVLVLGTAQDGGLPQIGCEGACCEAAREDPSRRRLVTSLLIVDPRSGRRYLLDATPDLPEQVERCRGLPPNRRPRGTGSRGRPPLFDGIFPTHAHLGHYAGLAFLGREAYASQPTPVYASERLADFLRSNGPWSLLVEDHAIELLPLADGRRVRLGEDLTLTPIAVPHRDEFSDTYAFLVRGPTSSLLYLPDIDKWEAWDRRVEDLLGEVDVALLDGTFFDGSELPERDLDEIAHPAIVESMARFEPLSRSLRRRVLFTHLNHSNPVADPDGEAAAEVRRAGFGVAREGAVFGL